MTKAEFIAMRLAGLADLDVAPVKLVRVMSKNVLLIGRFDTPELSWMVNSR